MKKSGKKLWGGRFAEKTDPQVEQFTASVHYEARLIPYDIQGSIAQAKMLGKTGILKPTESARLVKGLQQVHKEWQSGKFNLKPEFEDVHGNVEGRLKELLGDLAGKLHTGRSRNDQIALDERLYLRDEAAKLILRIENAIESFLKLAEENLEAVMPGYTHLQRAQPIAFSHWCMAYVEMLFRDRRRLAFAAASLDECPLGASALAGSPLPLDREYVAKQLGFKKVTANSLDTVSDRDYLLDLAYALSLIMAHLSRLGEEIVLYNSQEFGFFTLKDSFATGSSLMPQKKNPDVAELLRGKTGRAYGLLVHLLTLIKGQPLAYNRDMQEDKELLFQTLDLVVACLEIVPGLLSAIRVEERKMLDACHKGFLEATDAADFLVKKGVPFRQAHEVIGYVVQACLHKGINFAQLSDEDWKAFHPAFDPSVKAILNPHFSVSMRLTIGGTAPSRVKQALQKARKRLKEPARA